MASILIIDDDDRLAEPLKEYFERHNLQLTSATHPKDGLKLLNEREFELVILDIMLPDQNGFDVCKTIRKQSEIPIVMLTARGEVMDRVVGLELGADDYLAKPFEPRELVARIQNILKRSKPPTKSKPILEFKNLQIDQIYFGLHAHKVQVAGQNVVIDPGLLASRDEIKYFHVGVLIGNHHDLIYLLTDDFFMHHLKGG